jgi:hypothetical protein
MAAEILEAIESGRDVWVFDHFVQGPDRLENARRLLRERLAACPDPEEADFLTSMIGALEQKAPEPRRSIRSGGNGSEP